MRRQQERGRDIPSFVRDALDVLSEPAAIATEGLFRLSGSAIEVGRIQAALDAGEIVRLKELHVTASLLKLWLRQLPTPLLLHSLRQEWLDAAEAGSPEKLKALVAKLPKNHRFVLTALCKTLSAVSANASKNMMTPHNLAIVFAPTLLRSTTETESLVGTNRATDAVEALIEHYDTIFADAMVE
jgi:hypothetical protein